MTCSPRSSEQSESATGAETRTQAQLLIRLAGDAELFHTPGGEAYARYKVGAHFEIATVRGKSFRRWLIKRFYDSLQETSWYSGVSGCGGHPRSDSSI